MTIIVSTEVLPEASVNILKEWGIVCGRFTDEDLANARVLLTWPTKLNERTHHEGQEPRSNTNIFCGS